MQRNILLLTDFSDNAWSAIVYALKLYANKPCTFYVLNALPVNITTVSSKYNKAKQELFELKEQMEQSNINTSHTYKTLLSTDNLYKAITTAINKYDINLIVTGTKGATGAKEFFLGSNSVTLLEKVKKCPVLIVPEEHDFVPIKQIAFPTDYNRFYSDRELQTIKEFADLYNSKIRILHINEEEQLKDIQHYNRIKLTEYLKEYDYSFHWMPEYTKKAEEIAEFIKDLEIDVLAMVNYKHSLIEKITKEPVIKTIGFHPTVPFLVIPE
ncbi:universal stress protein [Pontimicrobium sp. MEBiC01747]|jgi:nucleotide-binding universal stress UspA family protein